MTTLLPERHNLLWNPRGQAEASAVLEERRRNLALNPRAVSTGTAPTAYAAGNTGTVTRGWGTGLSGFPTGVATSRQITAQALGPAATDRAGDYVDLPATPGAIRTVSAHVRRVSGATGKPVRLAVEFRSATTALAPQVTASANVGPLSNGVSYATRINVTTAAAPAGTTTLRVYLWAEGAGSGVAEALAWEWTALLVEDGGRLGGYFDGASAAESDDGGLNTHTLHQWTGAANASTSSRLSAYVEAVDGPTWWGNPVKAYQPLAWDYADADALDVRSSWYRWRDGTTDAVRVQLPAGGSTPGPVLTPDSLSTHGASYPGTLLVEARREVAGSAVALTVTHNGTPVAGVPALGDAYATLRIPLTLVGGTGAALNTIRVGKTGAEPVLIRAVALVDEANYAGPYFDGASPTVGVLDSVWTEPQDAPNSSSYQGTPSLSITAAAEPAVVTATTARPPRVRLEVADLDTFDPARAVTVLRVDSSGRRTPVRSADGGPVELPEVATGTAVTLYDYEAPLGVSSSYVIGDAELPFIPSARVTPNDTRPWLIHPGVPARSRRLSIARLGKRVRRVVEGIYDVVGRPDPIVRTDGRRKSAESELVVRTATDAEREALDALLDDATTLLLSIPPALGWGLTYEWVAIGDSSEDRTANTGTWPRRLWTLPFRVVGRPIGGTRSARTWHDVANEAASWRALADQLPEGRRTWHEVADPTTAG